MVSDLSKKESIADNYTLDGINPNEKVSHVAGGLGSFASEVYMMLEGVGAPEKRLILSPEILKAEVIKLSDDDVAKIGQYVKNNINDIDKYMSAVSTFPKANHPLFIEYNHRARFNNIEEKPLKEGISVPEKIGLLVFRDPQESKLMNMFVVWKDANGGLYHSYSIVIIDEEKLDDNASKRNMLKIFREKDIPDIIEASSSVIPQNMKEEMFTVHDMDAVNDPRREMAVLETQKRALAEYPFFLAVMIFLSNKDKKNHDFGFSNPFRESFFKKINNIFVDKKKINKI